MNVEIKSDSIELVPIEDLKENPDNTNEHPAEQIERLIEIIEHQGFRNPLTVSKRSGYVLCGHGRIEAAKALGFTHLPVMFQDFESEAQEYEHLNADNEIGRWARTNLSKVNSKILDLGPELQIEMLGIKDFVLEPAEKFEPKSDQDAVPEIESPISRPGDVWLLGENRLLCGDSTNIEDVEKLTMGQKVQMVFTDPPYRQQTTGGENDGIGKKLGRQGDSIEFIADFEPEDFLNVLPTVFDNGINAYIFCNKELLPDYLTWARDGGYNFNVLVWKKPNPIPVKGSHRPDIEYLVLIRKNSKFNSGVKGVNYSKVLEHSRERGLHPTMKPVDLVENQLRIGSEPGGLVLDFFGGSGSTLIACVKAERRCCIMEVSPKYVDTIVKRWEDYTRGTATLEATGETFQELNIKRSGEK